MNKSIFLLASSLLLLSGCYLQPATQWMPNGYYYHSNTRPITNPAPSRPWVTAEDMRNSKKVDGPKANEHKNSIAPARQSYNP